MKLNKIILFLSLSISSLPTLWAATCGNDLVYYTLTGDDWNTLTGLQNIVCSNIPCTGAGALVAQACQNGDCSTANIEAEAVLQPYTCPDNCWNAMSQITCQCMENDRCTFSSECLWVYTTATWSYGNEWYWSWGNWYAEGAVGGWDACNDGGGYQSCYCQNGKPAKRGLSESSSSKPVDYNVTIHGKVYNRTSLKSLTNSLTPEIKIINGTMVQIFTILP